MKINSITKQLKIETEQNTPNVLDAVMSKAQSQGLLGNTSADAPAADVNTSAPKRRKNLFVTILSPILAVVICLAVVLPITLTNNSVPVPSWQQLTIKDFSRYTAIAAGTYNANDKSNQEFAAYCSLRTGGGAMQLADKGLTAGDGGRFNRLLGVDERGNVYPVEFVEDSKFIETYGICRMVTYGKFTFIEYARNYSGRVFVDNINMTAQTFSLVLDTSTGKAYRLDKFSINSVFGASQDAFYILLIDEDDSTYICKVSVVDGKLEVRELFDANDVPQFYPGFRADKYGNLYSYWMYDETLVYTTQGQLVAVPGYVEVAANGIAYSINTEVDANGIAHCNNKWFDKNGDLVEADFVPNDFINLFNENARMLYKDIYRYQEDNVYYFYYDKYNSYLDVSRFGDDCSHIVKYEFLDDVRYNVEIYKIDCDEEFYRVRNDLSSDNRSRFVGVNERLYFHNLTTVYYYDMKTGSYHTLSTGHLFHYIYTDEVGVIKFCGLDSYLNHVNGVINFDDTVDTTVDVNNTERKIYYLLPLN